MQILTLLHLCHNTTESIQIFEGLQKYPFFIFRLFFEQVKAVYKNPFYESIYKKTHYNKTGHYIKTSMHFTVIQHSEED